MIVGAILILKFLESLYLEQTFESLPFRDSREAPIYTNQDIFMQLLLRCIFGYSMQKDQGFCSNYPLLSRVIASVTSVWPMEPKCIKEIEKMTADVTTGKIYVTDFLV